MLMSVPRISVKKVCIRPFDVIRKGKGNKLSVTLNMPGWHNMLNSLAAIAVATKLEVDDEAILKSLAAFTGCWQTFPNEWRTAPA